MGRVLLLIVMFTGLLSGCQSDSGNEPSPDASRAAPIADATVIDMAHQDGPLADMLVDRGTRVDTGAPPENQTDMTVIADAEIALDADMIPDLLCEDRCLEGSLEWGLTGGLTAFTVLNTLSPCRQQIMSVETFYAEDPHARRCERQIAHCPDPNALALASVAALLDMPPVFNAFENAAFFGVDSRPYDGPILFIRHGNRELLIGELCAADNDFCQDPPVEVTALVDALETLRVSMSETVDCIGITDEL